MKISKKTERYCFPAVFTYADGEEIAVWFPDLDVSTSGINETDALSSARDLLRITILGLEEDGEDIPKASPLSSIKLDKNQTTTLVDVSQYSPLSRH